MSYITRFWALAGECVVPSAHLLHTGQNDITHHHSRSAPNLRPGARPAENGRRGKVSLLWLSVSPTITLPVVINMKAVAGTCLPVSVEKGAFLMDCKLHVHSVTGVLCTAVGFSETH